MRIVILTNAGIGLVKFRKELLERLSAEHEVFAVFPEDEFAGEIRSLGCKTIPFDFNRRGMNPAADLGQMSRYVSLLKELPPDVVLTYTIQPNVYGGMACRKAGIPYLANVTGLGTALENGGILGSISSVLYKKGLKKASCVFFQNENNMKTFSDKGIFRGRTRLVPGSGVNLDRYPAEPYPEEDGTTRFLFVGRIMRDKGVSELLTAVRRIHAENETVTLDLVGWCDEDYSDAIREAENEGAVRFRGLQTDVRPFYRDCHCAVLPSYHEGMANVMLEASASGRPVITTNVPGCRETFDEGVTGFGCETGNVESLENAMRRFLALSRDRRVEMGKEARAKMEREFDRDRVIDAYIEELDALTRVK